MIRAVDIYEAYKTAFTVRGNYCTVFVNPNQDDFKEINSENLRALACDRKKVIYVWDANLAIHGDVMPKVNIGGSFSHFIRGIFLSELSKSGNKYIQNLTYSVESMKDMFLFEPGSSEYWKDVLERDWTWTRKYNIDLDSTFNIYRKALSIRPR